MGKKLLSLLMILLTLTACRSGGGEMLPGGLEQTAEEAARQVRTQFLAADGCAGTVAVTADYGLRVYEFTLDFSWQREGETVLTLTAPEELAGLTARVAADASRLEFEGISLDTGDLTGDGLTPLELLPTLLEQTQEGYMAQCSFEPLEEVSDSALRVEFRNPEAGPDEGLKCVEWFAREGGTLLRGELYWDGELVLSGAFSDFTLGDDTDHGYEQNQNLGGDQSEQPGA